MRNHNCHRLRFQPTHRREVPRGSLLARCCNHALLRTGVESRLQRVSHEFVVAYDPTELGPIGFQLR